MAKSKMKIVDKKYILLAFINPVRHSNHRDDSTVLRHLYETF